MTTQRSTEHEQLDSVMDPQRLQAVLTEARRQRGLYFARMMKALGRALIWPLRRARRLRSNHHPGLPHSA